MKKPTLSRITLLTICLTIAAAQSAETAPKSLKQTVMEALSFHASFDDHENADLGQGDNQLYTLTKDKNVVAGNATNGKTLIEKGEGLIGNCLRFTKRDAEWLFYKAARNIADTQANWQGSVSVWLKLDPETDLDPGYTDPILLTTRQWNDAAFFVDFDKEGNPRDFRLGAFADLQVWKPANKNVDDIPESQRPLAVVSDPPFDSDRWTHVVFSWSRFNTGKKDGVAKLYLNGRHVGTVSGWEQTFTWKASEEARLYFGLNYIGLLDELSGFNKSLTDPEIAWIYRSGRNGYPKAGTAPKKAKLKL